MTDDKDPAAEKPQPVESSDFRTQVWLVTSGTVLAFWGQGLLRGLKAEDPQFASAQGFAVALLVAGAILFGIAGRQLLRAASRLDFSEWPSAPSGAAWYEPKWGLALGGGLGLLALIIFADRGENLLVVALWLASLLALFAAQFFRRDVKRPTAIRDEWPYLALLVIVLAAALWARIVRLDTLPYNLDGDFASFGLQAREISSGTLKVIFGFGWAAGPLLGFLPAAAAMKLFGDSIVGLYASGVVLGTISILGIYLLARDLFDPRVGIFAAALLAASYAHLAASRMTMMADPLVFLIFSLYFLLLGLREDRGWAVVASGVLTALGLEAYHAGQILVPLLVCVLAFFLLANRTQLLHRLGFLGLWLIALVLTLGPMIVVFARYPETLYGRAAEVFILNPQSMAHQMQAYGLSSVPAVLFEQLRRSALLFHFYIDQSPNFSFPRPLLDPITAPLFTLGFGVAALSLRRLRSTLLVAWIFLGVLLGSFAMLNPPSWSHLIIVVPPAILLAAAALNALYLACRESLRDLPRPAWLLAPLMAAVLVAAIGLSNWKTYETVKGHYADARTRIARYIRSEPADTPAYFVGPQPWGVHDRVFDFLVPGRIAGELSAETLLAGQSAPPSPALLILLSDQTALLQKLQSEYPDGTVFVGPGNSGGEIVFYAFKIP